MPFGICLNHFFFEYLQEQMKNFSEQINISSCAYSFLMNMHQEMLIYSFNYTNPYKYIDESLQNKYSDIEIKACTWFFV